jgi:CRISPR-associated protein Cmr2
MSYLFLFSIGPVQSFIAQARKSQDLFAGSKLLSDLCKSGMAIISEKYGPDAIITPYYKSPSVPNRLLAKVDGDMQSLGMEMDLAVKGKFKQLAAEAFKGLKYVGAIDAQIENHLDIHWLAVPFEDLGYESAYQQVENLMGAIKNIRNFKQYEYQRTIHGEFAVGEKGRKCSLDGERNVVIYRKSKKEKNKSLDRKLHIGTSDVNVVEADDESIDIWLLSEGEGLSAISYIKRTYLNSPHTFPSTARVALFHLIEKIEGLDEFTAYERAVKAIFKHSNDELLFAENINDEYFAKLFNIPRKDKRDIESTVSHFKNLHQKITHRINELQIVEPFTKYYALLQFDGDKMGEWLAGDKIEMDAPGNLEEFHRQLTQALADFAAALETIITPPIGKIVFAGGEDFLGFVNLHSLFLVLSKIHQLYDEKINQRTLNGRFKLQNPAEKFTISAGIVLAHYKEPLSEVVSAASKAERFAKNNGRDGFAIQVLKHSGSELLCHLPWASSNTELPLLLDRICANMKETFSPAFVHELCTTLDKLGYETISGVVEAEIKRTIRRAHNADSRQSGDDSANDIKTLTDDLFCLLSATGNNYENFSRLLLLCDFIDRKTN